MHLAIAHRKRLPRRADARSTTEDAVTSSVLGTLKYLPPGDVARLLARVLGDRSRHPAVNRSLALLSERGSAPDLRLEARLWPNRAARGRIEPDAEYRFRAGCSDGKTWQVSLLIECKWQASESGRDQLWRQWCTVPPAERDHWIHVYLVRSLAEGTTERLSDGAGRGDGHADWRQRVCVLNWGRLAETPIPDASPTLRAWQADMRQVLDRLGVNGFGGFQGLTEYGLDTVPGPHFWRPFRGFRDVGAAVDLLSGDEPAFWRGNTIQAYDATARSVRPGARRVRARRSET